jgi:DNA polymerase-1
MKHLTHTVANTEAHIYYPESRQDLAGFDSFISQGDKVLCVDSETTGLDIFSPGYGLRLVQFGNATEAWVLRADQFRDQIIRVLRQDRHFVAHNATFDLLVFDQMLGVKLEETFPKTFDTRTFAHLLDPRSESEGGAGLSLKPLSAIYVDDQAPDTQSGLHKHFRELGFTKETGWAGIPIDDELYVRYAGLDVILGHRLFTELAPMIRDLGLNGLSQFEHHLSSLLAIMQRKGMKLDMQYIDQLDGKLEQQHLDNLAIAARYGVENINSTAQIAEALQGMGEELTERTPSGAVKVDKAVLEPLADVERSGERIGAREPNPLAQAVMLGKRAEKWREAYVGAFRNLADANHRLHPSIGGLQARTARMSVSRPPLQQLPSSDWMIRRAIVADPGHMMISADYDQVELRVLAALADVRGMKEAIHAGEDLHGYTATLVYGKDYTKFHRKLMKGVGFGKVYGGGAATLARQTGAPFDQVKQAVAEYDRVYPEIKRYGTRLQRKAEYGRREVVTVTGRHLPLDRDRLYASTNYMVQSTARDVIAQAIVEMFDAGLGDYLLLPVHDEVLASAPREDADDVAREIGKVMSRDFYGVPLTATGEVTGRSWGSAYKCPPEEDYRGE